MVTLVTALAGFGAFALILLGFLGESEPWSLREGDGPLVRLQKRKLQLLRQIRALDAEHASQPEADESYSAARSELKRRAIEAARRLEEARAARIAGLLRPRGGVSARDRERIEALVRARAEPWKLTSVASGVPDSVASGLPPLGEGKEASPQDHSQPGHVPPHRGGDLT